jgi:endonuclease G
MRIKKHFIALIALFLIVFAMLYKSYFVPSITIWMGVPQTQQTVQILENEAYIVGYSEVRRNPLWVSYDARPKPKKSKYSKRPKFYPQDKRLLVSVQQVDYKNTGYDRGHLAPNYLIGSRYGKKAQTETFLMTNITPQKPKLNRKLWQRLEEVIADKFSNEGGYLLVLTGPIFDESPKTLKGTSIQIPSAFYKLLIRPSDDLQQSKVLAFVMPQKVKGTENLAKFVVCVDEIERRTGLDFFHELPDKLEIAFEKTVDIDSWDLLSVANKAPRY